MTPEIATEERTREQELTPGQRRPLESSVPTLSVRDATAALRRGWRTVLVSGFALAVLVTLVLLVRARSYTSSASFAPQARKGNISAIAGFAAQLGVGLPASDPTQSPAFFADLVSSREVLGPVFDSLAAAPLPGSDRFIRTDVSDRTERRYRGILALRRDVRATIQPKTGVVTLTTKSTDPQLSYRVATLVLAELNRFNLITRQSQAAAERRFVERRMIQARDSLREAEGALSAFLSTNRGLISAADLKMREARLSREVDLRQQVYVTLAQSLEQAKIDEVRDTPVLSVIEAPNRPVFPDSRQIPLLAALSAFFGAVLAAWVIIVRQLFYRPRAAESRWMP